MLRAKQLSKVNPTVPNLSYCYFIIYYYLIKQIKILCFMLSFFNVFKHDVLCRSCILFGSEFTDPVDIKAPVKT